MQDIQSDLLDPNKYASRRYGYGQYASQFQSVLQTQNKIVEKEMNAKVGHITRGTGRTSGGIYSGDTRAQAFAQTQSQQVGLGTPQPIKTSSQKQPIGIVSPTGTLAYREQVGYNNPAFTLTTREQGVKEATAQRAIRKQQTQDMLSQRGLQKGLARQTSELAFTKPKGSAERKELLGYYNAMTSGKATAGQLIGAERKVVASQKREEFNSDILGRQAGTVNITSKKSREKRENRAVTIEATKQILGQRGLQKGLARQTSELALTYPKGSQERKEISAQAFRMSSGKATAGDIIKSQRAVAQSQKSDVFDIGRVATTAGLQTQTKRKKTRKEKFGEVLGNIKEGLITPEVKSSLSKAKATEAFKIGSTVAKFGATPFSWGAGKTLQGLEAVGITEERISLAQQGRLEGQKHAPGFWGGIELEASKQAVGMLKGIKEKPITTIAELEILGVATKNIGFKTSIALFSGVSYATTKGKRAERIRAVGGTALLMGAFGGEELFKRKSFIPETKSITEGGFAEFTTTPRPKPITTETSGQFVEFKPLEHTVPKIKSLEGFKVDYVQSPLFKEGQTTTVTKFTEPVKGYKGKYLGRKVDTTIVQQEVKVPTNKQITVNPETYVRHLANQRKIIYEPSAIFKNPEQTGAYNFGTNTLKIQKDLFGIEKPTTISHELIHYKTPKFVFEIENKLKIPYDLQPSEIIAHSFESPNTTYKINIQTLKDTTMFTKVEKYKPLIGKERLRETAWLEGETKGIRREYKVTSKGDRLIKEYKVKIPKSGKAIEVKPFGEPTIEKSVTQPSQDRLYQMTKKRSKIGAEGKGYAVRGEQVSSVTRESFAAPTKVFRQAFLEKKQTILQEGDLFATPKKETTVIKAGEKMFQTRLKVSKERPVIEDVYTVNYPRQTLLEVKTPEKQINVQMQEQLLFEKGQVYSEQKVGGETKGIIRFGKKGKNVKMQDVAVDTTKEMKGYAKDWFKGSKERLEKINTKQFKSPKATELKFQDESLNAVYDKQRAKQLQKELTKGTTRKVAQLQAPISTPVKLDTSLFKGTKTKSKPSQSTGFFPITGSYSFPETEEYKPSKSLIRSISQPNNEYLFKPEKRSLSRPMNRTLNKPSVEYVTRPMVKPVSFLSTKPITHPITKPITRPITRPITKPITKPITRPITRPISKPISRAVGRTTTTTFTRVPRTKIPKIIPQFKFNRREPFAKLLKKKKRKLKREYGYNPSLEAISFGIKGKKPSKKAYTMGLDIRPITR